MKKCFLLFFAVFLSFSNVFSQDSIPAYDASEMPGDELVAGLGVGLDHGGIGGKLIVNNRNRLSAFVGAGYNWVGLGLNAGLKYRFRKLTTEYKNSLYATAMYGYHSVVKISGADDLNKVYYGATVGLGYEFFSNPTKSNSWTIAVLVPLSRGPARRYMDYLEDHYGVEFKNDLTPVNISIGYNFRIR